MTVYVALLRGVNVGGANRLSMPALVELCRSAGFERVRTSIASGNVLFTSRLAERRVKALLEQRLEAHMGKPIRVLVRTRIELASVITANPFARYPPERTVAIFLDAAPPPDTIEAARGRSSELLALGTREIYVLYRDGIAHSKLLVPAAQAGTARNMNTIARLADMAGER